MIFTTKNEQIQKSEDCCRKIATGYFLVMYNAAVIIQAI